MNYRLNYYYLRNTRRVTLRPHNGQQPGTPWVSASLASMMVAGQQRQGPSWQAANISSGTHPLGKTYRAGLGSGRINSDCKKKV